MSILEVLDVAYYYLDAVAAAVSFLVGFLLWCFLGIGNGCTKSSWCADFFASGWY